MYGKKMLKTDATKTLLVDAEKAEVMVYTQVTNYVIRTFSLLVDITPDKKSKG